jgi:uncharacterized protein with GYD domain
MVKNPHNRLEEIRPVMQRLRGNIEAGWMMFGDYDMVLVCQLPDSVTASALTMAISSGGVVQAIKTTSLLGFEKGVVAMKKAREAEYTPPPSDFPYFGA